MMKYPILDPESKQGTYPLTGQCPVCGSIFKEKGFVFFSAGTIPYDQKENMVVNNSIQMKSYLRIGFHGVENFNSSERSSETYFSMSIVDFLKHGEFEFNFCSINCMRLWFNTIFNDFQKQYEFECG